MDMNISNKGKKELKNKEFFIENKYVNRKWKKKS